jgi:25S rRNA (uracil2634-N3)-methyltransferase
MAKGKLKSALLSHQIQAERLKNEQRAKERREAIAAVTEARKGRGRGKGKLVGPSGPVAPTTGAVAPGGKKAKVAGGSTAKVNAGTNGDQELPPIGPTETRTKPPRRTIPFARDDTILLLGEANFSFSHSLLLPPHSHPAHQICATSYDSETVCYEKYPDAKGLVGELRELGVKVGFGVDAGELGKSWKVVGKGKRWSRVIFNFPHVGGSDFSDSTL